MRRSVMSSALASAALMATSSMMARRFDEEESIVQSPREDVKITTIPADGNPVTADRDAWMAKVRAMTEPQAHAFRALRNAGASREDAYAEAIKIPEGYTMAELQAQAKRELCARAPKFAAAEAKRERKAAKLRALAEKGAIGA